MTRLEATKRHFLKPMTPRLLSPSQVGGAKTWGGGEEASLRNWWCANWEKWRGDRFTSFLHVYWTLSALSLQSWESLFGNVFHFLRIYNPANIWLTAACRRWPKCASLKIGFPCWSSVFALILSQVTETTNSNKFTILSSRASNAPLFIQRFAPVTLLRHDNQQALIHRRDLS